MPRCHYSLTCAVVAAMTPLLIGFHNGAANGSMVHGKELVTPFEDVTTTVNVVSIFGMVTAGLVSDLLGRRATIIVAGIGFLSGRMLMGFGQSYAALLGGRLIANIGVGYALTITPLYVAEVSPASSRGRLSSLPEVFFSAGTVLGHALNYFSSKAELSVGWRVGLGLAIISSHLIAIGILALPESPRWLVMRGRLGDARQVLCRIADSHEEAALRLPEMQRAAGIPMECNDDIVELPWQSIIGLGAIAWLDLLLHPTRPVFHILVCVLAMHSFRQASSVDTLLHGPPFFKNADIADSSKKLLATIVVGLIKTVCMLYPTLHLDSAGRRPLMLFSIRGMFWSLFVLGACLIFVEQSETEHTWLVGACLALVLLYLVFFSVGLGPITTTYSSEVLPLRLRAQGSAIGFALSQAVTEVSSMSFLWLGKTITFAGAAFLLATIGSAMGALFYLMMIEPRGLSLEEIERLFGHYIEWRPTGRVMEQPRSNMVDRNATMSRPPSRAIPGPSDGDDN